MTARRVPPNLAWLALEPVRGVAELGLGTLLHRPLARVCPRGDGHPVLILPGLGAHDMHTLPMRRFVARLGYQALPWKQGLNLGPREGLDTLLARLEDVIDDAIAATRGRHAKVSIIGWSLGGIFARELAKRAPDKVRQVVTLGTPFGGHPTATHATSVYELVSGHKATDPETIKRVRMRPSVPVTSIFSKTDGVVAWPSSVESTTERSENIPVSIASHLGLIANPAVLYIVANRLAQPEAHWRPYRAARLTRWF
jgi:pimeloyl-ACP methyl ester carboxylesterase